MPNFLDKAIGHRAGAEQILIAHQGCRFELKGSRPRHGCRLHQRNSHREATSRSLPHHGIIAEEGCRVELEAPLSWYVDPLYGASSFAHGYPIWNVTLWASKK